MRIPAVVILCVLDLPSPGHADCYGLHEPNALEQRRAYTRDCETIRSLISCGIKERDAIAIVLDRHAMEGYMAQLIAQCETARAKATGYEPASRNVSDLDFDTRLAIARIAGAGARAAICSTVVILRRASHDTGSRPSTPRS